MPAVSPKRSPAPQPPSPAVYSERSLAFSFPAAPSPPVPPSTPHHPSSVCGTPPPLPPRRRRDSTAPHTPLHLSCSSVPSPAASTPLPAGTGAAPPPLPPRPLPAPALLWPAHSAILQRRQHTNTTCVAPRLPPKPPPVSGRP